MKISRKLLFAMGAAISFVSLSGKVLSEETKDSLSLDSLSASANPDIKRLSVQPQIIGQGARLAVMIKAVAGGFFGKNVAWITRPYSGVYCIKPTAGANLGPLNQLVPVVSVEWGTSSAYVSDALFAYIRQTAANCPVGTIQVDTWDGNYGYEYRSSGVSFTLLIP